MTFLSCRAPQRPAAPPGREAPGRERARLWPCRAHTRPRTEPPPLQFREVQALPLGVPRSTPVASGELVSGDRVRGLSVNTPSVTAFRAQTAAACKTWPARWYFSVVSFHALLMMVAEVAIGAGWQSLVLIAFVNICCYHPRLPAPRSGVWHQAEAQRNSKTSMELERCSVAVFGGLPGFSSKGNSLIIWYVVSGDLGRRVDWNGVTDCNSV